jgi:endonuclease V-like protein UPF0215 family
MIQVAKKATQDGTYTVYVQGKPIAWGLSTTDADRLVERLLSTSRVPESV